MSTSFSISTFAGISRGDPDSYFALATLVEKTLPDLADRLFRAVARKKYQPAMYFVLR